MSGYYGYFDCEDVVTRAERELQASVIETAMRDGHEDTAREAAIALKADMKAWRASERARLDAQRSA